MKKLEDIIKNLQVELPYLREDFGVKKIGLFGSYVKEEFDETSDIDLVVEFDKPIGFKFMRLAEYLESRLGRKVDILTLDGIKSIRNKGIFESINRSIIYV